MKHATEDMAKITFLFEDILRLCCFSLAFLMIISNFAQPSFKQLQNQILPVILLPPK